MAYKGLDRRECERFVVPGATVCYKKDSLFTFGEFKGDFYPVVDISRGGMRFVCDEQMKFDSRVSVNITIPEEEVPLLMKGTICWVLPLTGQGYSFQIGLQFHPYGSNKGDNDPVTLERLITLEQKFLIQGKHD